MSAVLATTGLSVRFGGVHAVEDVDLEVEEGQLVGLIGPNSTGKTTFVDAITGFVRYTGTVGLDGQDLTGCRHGPCAARPRGTWQSTELFDDLSVHENLRVGAERPSVLPSRQEVVGRRIPHDEAAEKRSSCSTSAASRTRCRPS